MKRRVFMELAGQSGLVMAFRRKFRWLSGVRLSPAWPVSSYPNLPVAAAANKQPLMETYTPAGIGGGGAYADYTISSCNNLRLVATDMGTIFRSPGNKESWYPVPHTQAAFSSDLTVKSPIAFSPDGLVILYSKVGTSLQRSKDQGLTFDTVQFNFRSGELIRYFTIDSFCPDLVFMGTNLDLYISTNRGLNWAAAGVAYAGADTNATGTFIDYPDAASARRTVYHATGDHVYQLPEGGSWTVLPGNYSIRLFRGGRDGNGLTLLFVETDNYTDPLNRKGNIAVAKLGPVIQAADDAGATPHGLIDYEHMFGYMWLSVDSGKTFYQLPNMGGGMFACMAENDSSTIYSTGGYQSATQQGSKLWRSMDRGQNWQLKFLEYNQAVTPYQPWPGIPPSAPGLDIGWEDDNFHSFSVNPRNSQVIGGTNNFFLFTSETGGDEWQAPFTVYKGLASVPAAGQYWSTTGMENTSILRFRFHPANPKLAYGAVSDIRGLVTEDGCASFRITQCPPAMMQYDYAFDPADENIVLAAAGNLHDFPENRPNYCVDGSISGGIFKSTNKGVKWNVMTPFVARPPKNPSPIQAGDFNIQFLSVAYDPSTKYIYGGSQGNGFAFSADDGFSWLWLNNGLPAQNAGTQNSPELTIPQIEIDPVSGDIYCLVSGNAADSGGYTNYNHTGIYLMKVGDLANPTTAAWQSMGNPNPFGDGTVRWYFPVGFAVDWTDASRETFWLIDYNKQQQWLLTGIWQKVAGSNWVLSQPFTFPRHIVIDTSVAGIKRIYVNGGWEVTPFASQGSSGGSNGFGGPFHSDNGGVNWWKNIQVPLQSNGQCTIVDPSDTGSVWYSFFGGGLMHGPRPDQGTCQQVK